VSPGGGGRRVTGAPVSRHHSLEGETRNTSLIHDFSTRFLHRPWLPRCTGNAPKPTLDPLCQVLKAALTRFPDPCLRAIHASLFPPPSQGGNSATPLDRGLREALTRHHQQGLPERVMQLMTRGAAGALELSAFREAGAELWEVCQGGRGQEVLDRYLGRED
jgi:hypothetical protein